MKYTSPHKVLLGNLHKLIGRTTIGVKLAIKMKNQIDAVIRSRLNDGIDMSRNGELWLMSMVAPKAKLFLDVGANTGFWAIPFLNQMQPDGQGVLFEPSPIAAKILENNLKAVVNAVEIIKAAVGDISGKAQFFMEPDAGETSSLVVGHSQSGAQEIEVVVTTIDEELAKRKIDFVDFLKIDAEGFDLKVIKGATNSIVKHKIGIVQFEYNAPWAETGSTLAEALKLFSTSGYLVYILLHKGLYTFEYKTYAEYFGYSNFVAILPEYWSNHRESIAGVI